MPSARLLPVAVFVLFAVILVSLGTWYYHVDKQEITREKHEILAAIGKLKSQQVQQWQKERVAEAERAANDAQIRAAVGRVLSAPENPNIRAALRAIFQEEIPGQDRASTLLFDAGGNFLISSDEADGTLASAPTLKAVREALASRHSAFSDFYHGPGGSVLLDLATPVNDEAGRPQAVLVLRHDASVFLYPLIQSRPFPSLTAETLLVQRDGEEVVFLNELRHRGDTPLSLRYPLTATTMPAVQAIHGKRGIFQGKDYRGIEVVSDLQPVPGTPWFLIAKIDAEEILAEVRFHSGVISLIVGLLILLAAGLVMLIYRAQQTAILKKLVGSERRNRNILQTAMDGFCLLDTRGRIQEVNEAYSRMTGFSRKELLTMRIGDLDAVMAPEAVAAQMQKVLSQGGDRFETRQRCKDGTLIDLDVSVQFHADEGLLVSFLHDITERKAREAKITHMALLFEGHSECSQSIVHSASPEELLQKICRNLVEYGGMKMVWVAKVDEKSGKIFAEATYGDETGYLEGLELSLDKNNPLGRGLVGTAIREGRPVWCQDFLNDPTTAPWHERGAAFGWKSAAALPLRMKGKPISCLTFYSLKQEAFEEDVRHLLVEIAENISFALDHFAQENEKRKAEHEVQVLRTAIEQTDSTIVITDTKGTIEYANPAFESSSGYTSAEAIGRTPRILNSGEQSRSFYQQLWLTITSGNPWQGQFHNRRKDGGLYWESAIISPVRNASGEIAHYIAVKEDISHRIILEANLSSALDKAESASRAKSEFLAMMSHELRTPLNGILGFTAILSETSLDADQQGFVRTVHDSGEHLLGIVNDILDFSSIENATLKLESAPVPVSDLVEVARKMVGKTAADNGLEFRCEIAPGVPERLLGDRRRILQILINLLGNAVKFTPEGSVILRVSPASDADRPVLDFSIEDTGPGIPPGTIALLFQPFVQGDSSLRRRFEGTGLGLAISQRLAQAMGGNVIVSSTPGKGSTFTLRLPADRDAAVAPEAKIPKQQPPNLPPAGGLVLVVEDDRVNGMLADKILNSLGMRVEIARTGRAAVEAFAPGKYAAIFMDVQMPEMNGIEATKMIRRIEAGTGTRVPIIALTANVMPADREQCLDAGMDAFLSKPFKKDEMSAKLACCLSAE